MKPSAFRRPDSPARRDWLRRAGAASLLLAAGRFADAGEPARSVGKGGTATLAEAPNLPPAFGRYTFFSAEERACVEAALARLIPADELGPGAVEAGVGLFIDQQLAGRYGQATDWYMQGPFAEGSKQQGYQSHFTPAGLYRAALEGLDAHCRQKYGGKVFAALGDDERDTLLHALE